MKIPETKVFLNDGEENRMILDGYQTDAYLKKLTQTSESKSETINTPKMMGWICPVCGAGLSPFISMCPCGGNKWKLTTRSSTSTL